LNTCATVSQFLGDLQRKIHFVPGGTTRTLLFQPRHRQEGVPLKDDLEGHKMFNLHGQHFLVDILCCSIFCPQKPHNATL
jgi:hypothetical protein